MPDQGVLVANPGSMRWMRPMATSLAQAGVLRTYVTSVTPGARTLAATARLPGPFSRMHRELTLRPKPDGVDPARVVRAGTVAEIASVAVSRSPLPQDIKARARLWAGEAFDRGVVPHLRRGDDAFVGMYGSSMNSLQRARAIGAAGLLDYPTAHHDYAERLLTEELLREPRWAPTMQFHTFDPRLRARLDAEIATADRIIVLTSFARRSFLESGVPADKLATIPLGVELDLFEPRQRKEQGSLTVLFAGQLTQRKGLSYLLEGFRRAAVPGSELILLGAPVGSIAPWAGEPGVRHIPAVPFFDLPRLYQEADVFVMPSLVEGFVQTPLQAMASGLPVIISENTFGSDVVKDGVDGYIVPIRDPDAIAERLRHLAEHPEERSRIGLAGRRRSEDFSWSRYGTGVVNAITTTLAAGRR